MRPSATVCRSDLAFITIGATNLLDEKFQFFDTNFKNPTVQPDRTVYARLTLSW